MFQTQVVEKIKRHFIFGNFSKIVLLKNIAEPDRPQMAI
jgi:hypothetical protein